MRIRVIPPTSCTRRDAVRKLGVLVSAPAILRGGFDLFGTGQQYSTRAIRLVQESVVVDLLNQFRFADYAEKPPKSELWLAKARSMTAADYAALCRERLGRECDYHPPQSTAALQVYQRAIEKADSLDPKKVRDALAQTNIMTAYGPVRFNEQGQNIAKGMSVVQLQNGKPVIVFPVEGAKSRFVYPMPAR